MNAHFICRDSLNLIPVNFPTYTSGVWAISEDDAKALVGGTIHMHQTKNDKSYFGGIVTGYRKGDGEYSDRIVFTLVSTLAARNVEWQGADHSMAHYSGLVA